MRKYHAFLCVVLLAVIVLVACAPSANPCSGLQPINLDQTINFDGITVKFAGVSEQPVGFSFVDAEPEPDQFFNLSVNGNGSYFGGSSADKLRREGVVKTTLDHDNAELQTCLHDQQLYVGVETHN